MKDLINRLILLYCIVVFTSCGGDEPVSSEMSYTDVRDGQVYRTIEMNGLTWMIDNMNYSDNDLGWVYRDDISYESPYGRMYDWWMTPQVCPEGWRLPTKEEYEALSEVIADGDMSLKSDEFNLLAGGLRQNNQGQYDNKTEYQSIDSEGFFWTSTEFKQGIVDMNGEEISAFLLYYNETENRIGVFALNKEHGFSVRCVQ
ncbi:MAG: hypothetical protein HKN68_01990 [Saprospiraceae bacterium]|nr:hypothetical protein [Saprospiraceae bacterium]